MSLHKNEFPSCPFPSLLSSNIYGESYVSMGWLQQRFSGHIYWNSDVRPNDYFVPHIMMFRVSPWGKYDYEMDLKWTQCFYSEPFLIQALCVESFYYLIVGLSCIYTNLISCGSFNSFLILLYFFTCKLHEFWIYGFIPHNWRFCSYQGNICTLLCLACSHESQECNLNLISKLVSISNIPHSLLYPNCRMWDIGYTYSYIYIYIYV